jgi:hypothetical protein
VSSASPGPRPPFGARAPRWPLGALAAILALAALLRFTGLGWGLRHPPHLDERVFVESTLAMLKAGDLDHRYYEYPGLVFYLLAPLLWPFRGETPGPQAYLVARSLIAAWGVLGCAVLYPLGRRLHSPAVGLAAALLMAVSLVAVETAHMFRPDVVLQALCALALLAFARLDGGTRREGAAGLALGAALAAKFSGVFLLPSYLAARLLAPGPQRARLLLGGAVAALAFTLLSPYALVHAPDFLEGVQVQLRYHYEDSVREPVGYGAMVAAYGGVWLKGLGAGGALLAVLGLVTALRAWRAWLPALLLALTSSAVLASSDVQHDRFLLPALSVGCLLAGAGAARAAGWVARPGPRAEALALAVVLLASAPPFLAAFGFARSMRGPLTRDEVLDWAEANVAPRARVLSSVPQLGLDPARFEVVLLPRLTAANRVQALGVDRVLSTAADEVEALGGLTPLATFTPRSKYQGRTVISAWAVPAERRLRYAPLALDARAVSATDSPQDVGALCDGRPDTLWLTAGPQQRGDRVEVHLPAPARVARLELELDPDGRFAARQLRLETSPDGKAWEAAPTLAGRAPVELQPDGPHSQVLLLTSPRPVRAFRLIQTGLGWRRRWGIAELRVWELPDGPA